MEEERTIKAGVEITESLHLEIKIEAARRRLKMKDAVRQAFELWLKDVGVPKSEQAYTPIDTREIPDSEVEYQNRHDPSLHEALDRLLDGDQAENIAGLIRHADRLAQRHTLNQEPLNEEHARILTHSKRLIAQHKNSKEQHPQQQQSGTGSLPGGPPNPKGAKPGVQPTNRKPDPGDRKRAS